MERQSGTPIPVFGIFRYQHAVANPGLITFTGPYLDVGGAGYVVSISHTIHVSR